MATQTITFDAPPDPGYIRDFVVPSGVTSITFDAAGAQGGSRSGTLLGGLGGRVQGTLTVTPGETLRIRVGRQQTVYTPTSTNNRYKQVGGFNGGGRGNFVGTQGGGATDIRRTGDALANRVVVAGGGGAVGGTAGTGGAGGGLTGGDGSGSDGWFGLGGTQAAGGAASVFAGGPGSLGFGGDGPPSNSGGAAGGGGYYGGGASGGVQGGGGGGSSYTDPVAVTGESHTQGHRSGNGYLTISFTVPDGTAPSFVAGPKVMATVDTLSVVDFQVLAADTTTLAYQWQVSTDRLAWSNATGTGATTATYTPAAGDEGKYLRVAVTATNSAGTALSTSYDLLRAAYSYTGAPVSISVPSGAARVHVDAYGAEGAPYSTGGQYGGGPGGRVVATLDLTGTSTITARVAGTGTGTNAGGYNGGGNGVRSGGGATDLRVGGDALANRVVVAGGGGGAGSLLSSISIMGGSGGDLVGDGTGGGGGTQAGGGSIGGGLGQGGNPGASSPKGGGGGGYYGGGYVSGSSNLGGGGGSNYTSPTTATLHGHSRGRSGDGYLFLAWEITSSMGTAHTAHVSISAAATTAPKAGLQAGAYLDTSGTTTVLAHVLGRVPAWGALTATATAAGVPTTAFAPFADLAVSSAFTGKGVRQMTGTLSVSATVTTQPKTWTILPRGPFETLPLIGRKGRGVRDSGEAAPVVVIRMGPERSTREGLGE